MTFPVLLASSLILYASPKGQVSNRVDWQVLGLDKQGWDDLHMIMGFLFVAFAVWHLVLHLRVIKNLLTGNKINPFGHRLEALLATLAIVVFIALTVFDLPPASWLLDLNEFLKHDFWAAAR